MKVIKHAELTPPILKTENICLRQGRLSDFEAIKAFRQDPENCRYIRPPEDDEETLKIVEGLSGPWKFNEGFWNGLVVCLTDDDTALGEIVFRVEDWTHKRAEIGYRLNQSAAGKGICTQATHLMVDHLFNEIGFLKLVARCDPRNIASYKVMEKLGFKREAFFKQHYLIGDEWTDQYDYGLLATEWYDEVD